MTETAAHRTMVKLIHADNFLKRAETENLVNVVQDLRFSPKDYGWELENFNMVMDRLEPLMSKVLGERVVIDHKKSGLFRRPLNNVIHFEESDSANQWAFVCALEKNTINFYHHINQTGQVDAESALQGVHFNYRNLFEWKLHTNVQLEPTQGVFFRPWTFHSLDQGLVQYYRLVTDRKFRVLVIGPPSSERKQMALQLAERIEGSSLLRSLDIRTQDKDIDYSYNGRLRHTYRMLSRARNDRSNCVILDHACPLDMQRQIINADILVVMTGTDLEWEHTHGWEQPQYYDFQFSHAHPSHAEQVLNKIATKRIIV
jgi:hypothetical protein